MRPATLAWLLPAAAAVLLFLPILGADFVYDDQVLLQENPSLRSWGTLWEGFTQPFWNLVPDPRRHGAGFYRPLGTAAFTILWKLGGGSPWPFHAASALLHGACAAAVALLALRLGWSAFAAGAAGLLFAAHGAHVEAVAWASALTYLLAGFFSLHALRAWAGGSVGRCAAWLIPALLSQELALGVWLLCLGGVWIHGEGRLPQRLRRSLPLLAALLPVYLLRMLAFGDAAAGLDRTLTYFVLEPWQEIGLVLSLVFRYLGFLLLPWPHAPFRPLHLGLEASDPAWWAPALGGAVLLVAGAVIWLWKGRRSTLILIPLGLLFAGIAPVLKTSSLGQFPFEERFLYIPSAGFCLLAAGALARLPARVATTSTLVALNAVSVVLTIPHWRNPEALFRWAREASPHAMLSHNEFGRVMSEKAQAALPGTRERWELAKAARESFEAGLAINPDEWFIGVVDREQGNVGLANTYFLIGEYETAEEAYRQLLGRWPHSVEGSLGLGAALASQGERHFQTGQLEPGRTKFEEALPWFDQALAGNPNLLPALAGKGNCLVYLGRYEEAIPVLAPAFEEHPGQSQVAFALAAAYAESQRFHFARRTLERFLEAAPEHPERELAVETLDGIERMLRQ